MSGSTTAYFRYATIFMRSIFVFQVSPMTKNVNTDIEKSNMSEDLAVSDGDHAKVFKTSALVCFQMKQSSGGLPDSRAK